MAGKKRPPKKAPVRRGAIKTHPKKGGSASPPPRYLQTPAPWYRKLIDKEHAFTDEAVTEAEIAEAQLEVAQLEQKRLLEEDYLKESIKLLRKYVKGFEPRDGFDLAKIAFIPEQRLRKVRDYAPLIREEIASPHITVRPRSRAARSALERHTGQTGIPGRKAFTVFADDPAATRVKVVPSKEVVRDKRGRKRTIRRGQVEVERKVAGGRVADRFFYLPEPPTSFDDIIAQTRRLLRFMPNGYYVLVTSTHGNIAAPMVKGMILQQLHDRYLVYDKLPSRGHKDDRGLAEVVVGFKLVSFTEDGARREHVERLTRREIAERERRAIRARQRRKALRPLRGLR